ncbi:hypothetical protein MMC13_001412 [Lambiella insularis]|nr:hypothetical protein [Lambiella insularis]
MCLLYIYTFPACTHREALGISCGSNLNTSNPNPNYHSPNSPNTLNPNYHNPHPNTFSTFNTFNPHPNLPHPLTTIDLGFPCYPCPECTHWTIVERAETERLWVHARFLAAEARARACLQPGWTTEVAFMSRGNVVVGRPRV